MGEAQPSVPASSWGSTPISEVSRFGTAVVRRPSASWGSRCRRRGRQSCRPPRWTAPCRTLARPGCGVAHNRAVLLDVQLAGGGVGDRTCAEVRRRVPSESHAAPGCRPAWRCTLFTSALPAGRRARYRGKVGGCPQGRNAGRSRFAGCSPPIGWRRGAGPVTRPALLLSDRCLHRCSSIVHRASPPVGVGSQRGRERSRVQWASGLDVAEFGVRPRSPRHGRSRGTPAADRSHRSGDLQWPHAGTLT